MNRPTPTIRQDDLLTDDILNDIMGDNKFDFTDENEDNEEITYEKYDSQNDLIGYQCPSLLEKNPNIKDMEMTVYVDLRFPIGDEVSSTVALQVALLGALANEYGISSGKACTDPPETGSSWLIAIKSNKEDIKREELFPKCRELSFDTLTEECHVYEAKFTGNALSGTSMPDVELAVEDLLSNSKNLFVDEKYQVQFLGVPQYMDYYDDRVSLNPPSNLKEQGVEEGLTDPKTITVLGGLLVAAFCLASFGIIVVLWRRRRTQTRRERNTHDIPPKQYTIDETDEEEPRSPYQYDIGNSFGNQVMGIHSSQEQQQQRKTQYLAQPNPNQGAYSHFHRPQDMMSDSDNDSWAQTDGTIGSLELQLDPITAEI
jgi:hypothetical protein